MKHHRYSLEPKVHFSPDEKQVIFRANFEGTTNVYAVEIEKAINNLYCTVAGISWARVNKIEMDNKRYFYLLPNNTPN